MRRHTIIYNPASGQGTAGDRLDKLKQQLNDAGIEYRIHLTKEPGHAARLARDAASERSADVVVAGGGDGTVNEVINGLMAARIADSGQAGDLGAPPADFPSLGVLPVGRGNDFAYGARIPTEASAGIQCLCGGHEEPLDIGLLRGADHPEGRYFGNGIGVGFDTIVGLEAAKMKRLPGFPGYVVAAFKTLLFYYVTPLLEMEIDDHTLTEPAIQISVMNGQRLGGGFFMAPDAVTNDAVFHWCIAGKPRRGQMLGLLLRYMKGTQAESRHIQTGTARLFSIRAIEGTMSIHADGETMGIGSTEVSFECLSAPLRVVTVQPTS